MADPVSTIEDLNSEQTARLVMDVMHRTVIHYALWFTEIRHQMGMEKALEALSVASKKSHRYSAQPTIQNPGIRDAGWPSRRRC
jgi:hypothetical protein